MLPFPAFSIHLVRQKERCRGLVLSRVQWQMYHVGTEQSLGIPTNGDTLSLVNDNGHKDLLLALLWALGVSCGPEILWALIILHWKVAVEGIGKTVCPSAALALWRTCMCQAAHHQRRLLVSLGFLLIYLAPRSEAWMTEIPNIPLPFSLVKLHL